jgi:hypothetical protein
MYFFRKSIYWKSLIRKSILKLKGIDKIIELLKTKASVKQDVFAHGVLAFKEFKESAKNLIDHLASLYSKIDPRVKLLFTDISEQEFRIVIAGDILIFHMHTNVFQYDKSHYYWKQSYFKEDPSRAYGIMFRVYNFLADSVTYNRDNDLGFLIARIFVNKENHFVLESKLRLGSHYPYLKNQLFTSDLQNSLMICLINYSMEFELSVPEYSNVQTVSIAEIIDFNNQIKTQTVKKLGFKFGADKKHDFE